MCVCVPTRRRRPFFSRARNLVITVGPVVVLYSKKKTRSKNTKLVDEPRRPFGVSCDSPTVKNRTAKL